MRFRRFDPLRYGHFCGQPLTFERTPDLHIVLGHNEGRQIHHPARHARRVVRHPRAHVARFRSRHEGHAVSVPKSRIATGPSSPSQRRKGNKETLLNPDGIAIPDATLAPYLDGMDADGFNTMFGLDHEGLRAGGRALLDAHGDVAGSIFGAASAMQSVLEVLKRLGDRSDDLFTNANRPNVASTSLAKPLSSAERAQGRRRPSR